MLRSRSGEMTTRIEPRSRQREARRRHARGSIGKRASRTTTSTAPISAAATSTSRSDRPGSTNATRSRSRPASRTATGARSSMPTITTHEPDREGPARSRSANDVAPIPATVSVEPRIRPTSGRSDRSPSSTGTTASRAKTTGRMRSASSWSVGDAEGEVPTGRATPKVSNRCSIRATASRRTLPASPLRRPPGNR